MANDKRVRRDKPLGTFNRQKFEQEVAEEIGISLDRTLGRASRRARNAVASPGAQAGTAERKGDDETR